MAQSENFQDGWLEIFRVPQHRWKFDHQPTANFIGVKFFGRQQERDWKAEWIPPR
jgi:hypothetical protein